MIENFNFFKRSETHENVVFTPLKKSGFLQIFRECIFGLSHPKKLPLPIMSAHLTCLCVSYVPDLCEIFGSKPH